MNPTRDAALQRLEEFLPRAGAAYARHRNFDLGPDDRSNISMLSPYIRHRLITEEEVTRSVLRRHGPRAAEKFLQEVAWRTYWKGWLEMRPTLWTDYQSDLAALPRTSNYIEAIEGRTGIECFDVWVKELIELGYLHNHTRMWFASIWIFTLRLPWQLGADLFMHHLLDADPASNTLSWRWVAGLHTPGKHYLARAWNIEKYTAGRFDPTGQLNEGADPLPLDRIYEPKPLKLPEQAIAGERVGHLYTPDDLSPPPSSAGPSAILGSPESDSSRPSARFLNGAIHDTQQRLSATLLEGDPKAAIEDWSARENLDLVTCNLPTVGPWRELTGNIDRPIHFRVCSWNRSLWPKAGAGFFKLKKSLPALHRSIVEGSQLELF